MPAVRYLLGGAGVCPAQARGRRPQRAIKKHLGLAQILLASTGARAQTADFSGVWDVAVRELGGINYYLPMTDGRLFVEEGGQARFKDVTFRVDLIADKALGQPRLENADHVMILGTGVTVDAAMKSATTEMIRWLTDRYGLTPHDIAPFLGTEMEYEIAEVVDSEYDVVAKVRKDALVQLGK